MDKLDNVMNRLDNMLIERLGEPFEENKPPDKSGMLDKCTINDTCPICPHNGDCAEYKESKKLCV